MTSYTVQVEVCRWISETWQVDLKRCPESYRDDELMFLCENFGELLKEDASSDWEFVSVQSVKEIE